MDIYLGACFIFAFLSLVKLAIVKYMRKKVSKRSRITSALNLFTSDLALNMENSIDGIREHSQERRRQSLTTVSNVRRVSKFSAHDRYWKWMKIFHIGSQLILPLAFGGFSVFYFFIYPYVNTTMANKCFDRTK